MIPKFYTYTQNNSGKKLLKHEQELFWNGGSYVLSFSSLYFCITHMRFHNGKEESSHPKRTKDHITG